MAKIPDGIDHTHVLQAIAALDHGVGHGFGRSTDYDLLHENNRYPPKAVIGLAAGFATGTRLKPGQFSSGIGAGQACRVLHDLGFRIVGKHSGHEVFGTPTFVPGQAYRRQELHDKYGGQRQGGISTPKDHPFVFLITGKAGSLYGYRDGFREDGTYWYTGEGQVGDMEIRGGNLAIRDHQSNGKTLHLFENVGSGQLQYIGNAVYLCDHQEIAPDRDGNPRKAIVFELSLDTTAEGSPPASMKKPSASERSSLWKQSLESLRQLAVAEPPKGKSEKTRKATVRQRSEAVRVYALRRADGICEGCGQPAPFKTASGKAYLEPHHTCRLADDGPDHPRWVAALCPNCHARVHYGADGEAFNRELIDRLAHLEDGN